MGKNPMPALLMKKPVGPAQSAMARSGAKFPTSKAAKTMMKKKKY